MIQSNTITIGQDDSGRRLDRVIRIFLPDMPLPQVYAAIRKGLIRINGKKTATHYKLVQGDVLTIASFLIERMKVHTDTSIAEKDAGMSSVLQKGREGSRFSILLHTDDLLIVNKPCGITVHGEKNSLEGLLAAALPQEQCIRGLSFRMGPLHRLDNDTSGIICFSQSVLGAQWFSQCLRERTIKKYYIGIVEGYMPAGTITTHEEKGEAINNLAAEQRGMLFSKGIAVGFNPLHFDAERRGIEPSARITQCYHLAYHAEQEVSCMLFALITGKKHQIRKHASYVKHPLIGDKRYGSRRRLFARRSYVLHAWRLYFPQNRPFCLPDYVEAPCFPDTDRLLARLFPHWYRLAEQKLRSFLM